MRRFAARDATVNDVFDWIDAKFGYERERLALSTMNGSRKFVYVDVDEDVGGDEDDEGGEKEGKTRPVNLSLEEAGFGKMTALRVTEIARDAPAVAFAAADDQEEEEDDEED